MNGAVVVSKRIMSENCMSDRWRIFFRMIRDRLGFEIVNHPDELSQNPDIVLICGTSKMLNGIGDIIDKNNWKTILYVADIHKGKDIKYRENLSRLVEKCDIHLSASDMWFRLLWTQHHRKHIYFPYFFAPQERYVSLSFNFNPYRKCLFAGHIAKAYPLRKYIHDFAKFGEGGPELFDVLDHPGNENVNKGSAIIGNDFARLLNTYGGCVTSTVSGCPTAKHFEIMASGSLLFSDRSWDLDALGLIPGKHYIEITTDSIPKKIEKVIAHLGRFQDVRMCGMEFARKKHGIESRFKQFKEILEKLK